MTDLDLIRAEVDLAAADPAERARLATELHRLRRLREVVIARGRRTDALIYAAARIAPTPRPLPEPPEEAGSSADLFYSPHRTLTTA